MIDQNRVALPSPGLPIKLAALDAILSFENWVRFWSWSRGKMLLNLASSCETPSLSAKVEKNPFVEASIWALLSAKPWVRT